MQYIVGIGTNLGDKTYNINKALKLLTNHLYITKISTIHKSKALLEPNSPKDWDKAFLNLTILTDFSKQPFELLKILKSIEKAMGRKQIPIRYAPRIIDLDILIAKNLILQKKTLQIPHQELLNRDFAVIPAYEVAPDFIHPTTKKTLKEHYAEIKKSKNKKYTF